MKAEQKATAMLSALLVSASQVNAQQPETMPAMEVEEPMLTEVMAADEIRLSIDNWEAATGAYYGALYGVPIDVIVDEEGKQLLVNAFSSSRLPEAFIQMAGEDNLRTAVTYDISGILGESFFASYPPSEFIAPLTEGGLSQVIIYAEDIEMVLAKQGCGIIPCDPQECGDDCKGRALHELFPTLELGE